MKPLCFVLFFLSLLAPALAGCDGDNGTQGDADADVQPDPVPDPAPDPTPDPIEDPVGDDAADVVEEDAPPIQTPITFIVRNTTEETVYLDWQVFGRDLIGGGRTTGGAWADVHYWTPYCMEACADYGPGEMCCIECLPPPSVRELGPGDEISMEWDGESLFEVDDTYCVCSCHRPLAVAAMAYRAEACAYATFECWSDPCEPDDQGIYADAYVTGDPACFETQFDIPYAGSEVVIEVN
jgi:hypothetical protein